MKGFFFSYWLLKHDQPSSTFFLIEVLYEEGPHREGVQPLMQSFSVDSPQMLNLFHFKTQFCVYVGHWKYLFSVLCNALVSVSPSFVLINNRWMQLILACLFTGESTFVDDHGPPAPRVSVLTRQTLHFSLVVLQFTVYSTECPCLQFSCYFNLLTQYRKALRDKKRKLISSDLTVTGRPKSQPRWDMHTSINTYIYELMKWSGLTNIIVFPVFMYFLF